jgi:hypothetical protein
MGEAKRRHTNYCSLLFGWQPSGCIISRVNAHAHAPGLVQAECPVRRHGWPSNEFMVLSDHLLRCGACEDVQVYQTTYHPGCVCGGGWGWGREDNSVLVRGC